MGFVFAVNLVIWTGRKDHSNTFYYVYCFFFYSSPLVLYAVNWSWWVVLVILSNTILKIHTTSTQLIAPVNFASIVTKVCTISGR